MTFAEGRIVGTGGVFDVDVPASLGVLLPGGTQASARETSATEPAAA